MAKLAPGLVRDSIRTVLREAYPATLSVREVHDRAQLVAGVPLPASSVRSSLRLRGEVYEQVGRGRYKLRRGQ